MKCRFLLLGLGSFACHKTAPAGTSAGAPSVVKDTVRVPTVVKDTARVVPINKDTVATNVFSAKGQTFRLQTPGQRDSLRAILRKERRLWDGLKPRDYRFLLRVSCFCPGRRGWLIILVRRGLPLRASDSAGNSVALTDWNTFTIDALYDDLERSVDRDGEIQIAFDRKWHFPEYVRTRALPGPDAWSIIELQHFAVALRGY